MLFQQVSLEKVRGLKLSKLIVLFSLLFPFTSFVEKLLKLSIGTEYTIKAVRVR
jgi:hypothetical protein